MAKKNNILSDLFLKSNEKKPFKWLFPVEIGMVIYAIFTIFVILFTSTSLHHPEALIWWRVRVVLLTLALWLVYRVWPCRAMALARIGLLLVTLSWWYPDTYVTSDNGVYDAICLYLSLVVEIEDNGVCEFVLVRTK